jgi:hypothetical protein
MPRARPHYSLDASRGGTIQAYVIALPDLNDRSSAQLLEREATLLSQVAELEQRNAEIAWLKGRTA